MAASLGQELWQQVRGAFPGSARLPFSGLNKAAAIISCSSWMKRGFFAFRGLAPTALIWKSKLLSNCEIQARVAVPTYDFVDPDGCFASYLLIAGSPLTPPKYSRLPEKIAHAALADAVGLLKSLHALNPKTIEAASSWPRLSSPVQFVDWIESGCLPLLANRTPALGKPIKIFLERYRHDRAPYVTSCSMVIW